LILSPFGYKETLYAPELGKWTKAAALMSEAIRAESTNATTFTFGPSGAVLYPTTGSSVDHIYTIGRAEFAYTIELPDYGDFGFVLPPERIRPTVEEQWVGQQVLLSVLDEEFFDGDIALLYNNGTACMSTRSRTKYVRYRLLSYPTCCLSFVICVHTASPNHHQPP
jgi:hypothetical protein